MDMIQRDNLKAGARDTARISLGIQSDEALAKLARSSIPKLCELVCTQADRIYALEEGLRGVEPAILMLVDMMEELDVEQA